MRQIKTKKNTRHKRQPMPWLLLLIGGGLLLAFGAVFALNRPSQSKAPIEVAGSPSLKVDQEEVNLGEVKLGQYVEVSFQLTNVGDKSLRFEKTPYVEIKEGC